MKREGDPSSAPAVPGCITHPSSAPSSFRSVCLSEGCYVAELDWEKDPLSGGHIHDAMGLLSELPICDLFLSPYLPSQEFCIDKVTLPPFLLHNPAVVAARGRRARLLLITLSISL
jgi:hypothetical protein